MNGDKLELHNIIIEFNSLGQWAGSFYEFAFLCDLENEEFILFNDKAEKIFAEELNQLCPLKFEHFNKYMLFSERQKFVGVFNHLKKIGHQIHDEDIKLKIQGENKIYRLKAQRRGSSNQFAIVVAQDVSEVYRIYEEELNSQMDAMFYKTAIDTFAMSLRLSGELEVTHASPEFMKCLKTEVSNINGFSLFALPGTAEGTFQIVKPESVLDVNTGWQQEVTFLANNGETLWFDMIVIPVTGVDGFVDSFLAIFHDNTAARMHEIEAQRETAWRSTILSHSPIAIISTDAGGEIITFNEAAEQITGYSSSEIVKRYNIVSFFEEREFKALTEELKINGVESQINSIELMAFKFQENSGEDQVLNFIKKDRSHAKVSLMVAAARNSKNDLIGFIFYVVDVTEKIRNNLLLEEQRTSLIAKSKMATLGEMSAGVAHEINNPLAIIRGKAELTTVLIAKNDATTLPRIKEHALGIVTMTERISKIVQGLRTFARDAEGDPFEFKTVSGIVDETLELCATRFVNHGIKLVVEPYDRHLGLECRYVQVSQVILNLLNNSFDAIQNCQEKWVNVKITSTVEKIIVIVTDSGSGIPQAIVDKIMNPFFTTKEVGKGTGLGLSISKGIAEAHQGQLYYNSQNPNTQFVLELPKRRASSKAA